MAGVFIKDEPIAGTPYRAASESTAVTLESQTIYKRSRLEQLVSYASANQLEEGVNTGTRLLETLKAPLTSALGADTQAAQWLEAIQQLQDKARPTQTVIGVVGNTGAGKSSVINAVLNEESLIPTNGMRACTAAATEISWNTSNDPAQLYRAEVDFIAPEDWAMELKNLFCDLIDGTGHISSEYSNPDTEAGLAYAKIKAVYPHQTKALLVNSNPDDMAQESAVRDVLGNVKYLAATDAATLLKELQHYVDSKEKSTVQETTMEYWPLIKVIRVYCKAHALATGAVIVDLPGVQDSNAARAAVAAKYLQFCTGIWITAAIQRAVDDKAAKVLLGDSFKRQLKFDGTYSAVTFICTKTDDVLVSEVSRSLSLDEELRERWQRIEFLQKAQPQYKQQLEVLRNEMAAVDNLVEDLDAIADKWEELADKLGNGEIVYKANIEQPKKRKSKSRPSARRKRHTSVDKDSDTESSEESDIEEENSQFGRSDENEQPLPLTSDEIAAELFNIKSQKKDLRKSKKVAKEAISTIKKELHSLNFEEKTLRSEIKSVCVKRRNDYSRAAIKNEFAMGVKELDQESAMAENEASFNPDNDSRDYEAIAQSLPVFCVSARAYQKLSGRLQQDSVQVDGFPSVEETEIPRLQEHTRFLTDAGRANNSRRFLHELDQLLNSMRLWASSDNGTFLSKEEQKADEVFVRAQLASLRKTFSSWGAYGSDRGLHYCTYKATTRRSGVFRHKNFNVELLDPVFRRLYGPWERMFQRALPSLLDDLAEECKRDISKFHSNVTCGVRQPVVNPVGLIMLQKQLRATISFVDAAPADLRKDISSQQREANRGFVPVIQRAMQQAYDICVAESGKGSYMRMKSAMVSHVDEVRHTMFHQAGRTVRQDLDKICTTSEVAIHKLIEELYTRMKQDYFSVLVQGNLPEAEKKLRASMRKDLVEADLWFTVAPREDFANLDGSVIEVETVDEPRRMTARLERGGGDEHEHAMDNNVAQQIIGAHDMLSGTGSVVEPRPMWM
ncbi:hypothetical protein N0V82_008116 [Gnomoniopsis sp. IMI 355080]|nr:hypothetical protein N0V82_008116 [Gnomoniopsis sp. IMI 355080]